MWHEIPWFPSIHKIQLMLQYLVWVSKRFLVNAFFKTVFDALHDWLHAISVKIAQVAPKVVQSGQILLKTVKNHFLLVKMRPIRVGDPNVWQLLKNFRCPSPWNSSRGSQGHLRSFYMLAPQWAEKSCKTTFKWPSNDLETP